MGIYIKGMEMPKNCGACPLRASCIHRIYLECRPEYCPLVPVPPHGRLIEEADAIETAWMILRGLGYRKEENPQLEQTVHEVFATAPTIEVE